MFNSCGNKHRLIVRINYASKTVFIRFVGTHSEYDKINADELELLATLIELYEKKHFPIDSPDSVEAIKFRMEPEGLTKEYMVQYLGSKSRVSEVFPASETLAFQ